MVLSGKGADARGILFNYDLKGKRLDDTRLRGLEIGEDAWILSLDDEPGMKSNEDEMVVAEKGVVRVISVKNNRASVLKEYKVSSVTSPLITLCH